MQRHESKSTAKQVYKQQRRARVPLSCDPCRSRKLKCNREQPCQNCITRAEQRSCKYRAVENGSTPPEKLLVSSAHIMQQRIDRLENLVTTLMTQNQILTCAKSSPSSDEQTGALNESFSGPPRVTSKIEESPAFLHTSGTTVLSGGQSVYNASNDWSDLLQEVNELRSAWNDTLNVQNKRHIEETLVDGPLLFSGQVRQADISELLATLPPKTQLDKLIEKFFDHRAFALPISHILHRETFMGEYTEHWKDPSQTNIMWLGIVFSILTLTMLTYQVFDDEPPEYEGTSGALLTLYLKRTAQCLMMGDIAKCLPYTLETLIFYTAAEYSRRDDNGRGQWMMTGIIVRAAINMGYHREPPPGSSISILQAELRRRVWAGVMVIECKSSFIVGFPSMMSAIDSDTLEPSNLHDWELSDCMTVLPSSRPLAENTPVTYLISKRRLSRALASIADFNNTLRPGSYSKVVEIDTELREAYSRVPLYMKTSSTPPIFLQSKTSSTLAMLQIEFLYHQGICSLHRRFLAKSRLDHHFSLSRSRCISSAQALLAQQHILHQAKSKPLDAIPHWYQGRQAFIIAAMILCLDLEHRQRSEDTDCGSDRDILLQTLTGARGIWKEVQGYSDEAYRVYHVLASMLHSFENPTPIDNPPLPSSTTAGLPESDQAFQDLENISFPENKAWNLSNEMDIDWATWGSFVEGASFDDAYQGIIFSDADIHFDDAH